MQINFKARQFIVGEWCDARGADVITANDPATEEALEQSPAASAADAVHLIAGAAPHRVATARKLIGEIPCLELGKTF